MSARRTAEPKQPGRGRRVAHLLLLFVAALIVVDGLVGERGLLATLRARRGTTSSGDDRPERAENASSANKCAGAEDPATIEEIALAARSHQTRRDRLHHQGRRARDKP